MKCVRCAARCEWETRLSVCRWDDDITDPWNIHHIRAIRICTMYLLNTMVVIKCSSCVRFYIMKDSAQEDGEYGVHPSLSKCIQSLYLIQCNMWTKRPARVPAIHTNGILITTTFAQTHGTGTAAPDKCTAHAYSATDLCEYVIWCGADASAVVV